jgi:hypothetical protein
MLEKISNKAIQSVEYKRMIFDDNKKVHIKCPHQLNKRIISKVTDKIGRYKNQKVKPEK